MLFTGQGSVRMMKNCDLGLENEIGFEMNLNR